MMDFNFCQSGGDLMQPSPRIFSGMATSRWADISRAYVSSAVQIGEESLTGPGQITELWRQKRKNLRPIFIEFVFAADCLVAIACSKDNMRDLCQKMTTSILRHCTWPLKVPPKWLILVDPILTLYCLNWCVFWCGVEILRLNMLLIFTYNYWYGLLHFRCQSGSSTQFSLPWILVLQKLIWTCY